jgi:hypothetical protein
MSLSPKNAPSSGVRIELRRNLRTLRPSKPWNDKPSISVKWFLFSSLQKSKWQSNETGIYIITNGCQPAVHNYIIICHIPVETNYFDNHFHVHQNCNATSIKLYRQSSFITAPNSNKLQCPTKHWSQHAQDCCFHWQLPVRDPTLGLNPRYKSN